MAVQLDTKRKEVANLIDALRTVMGMSTEDIVMVVGTLISENDELKNTLNRTLEDKTENETNYENLLKVREMTINSLKEENNKIKEELKNANKGLRRKAGGTE